MPEETMLTDSTQSTHELLITNRNLNDLNPVFAGYEQCTPNHFYGPTVRHHYLIHYVHHGKGYFIRNGEKHTLRQGDLFLIRPMELHKYYADKENPWYYSWIGFTGKQAEAFLASTVFQNGSCTTHAPHVEHVFTELQKNRFPNICLEFFLLSKIYELFTLLYAKKEENEYVKQAVNYICTNYMEEISVEKISRLLNIDRRHLSRLFAAQLGCTPKEYLIKIRLQNAANLLKTTDYSVSEIAKIVGYNDYCSFLKTFKKKYHTTPTDFR